MDSVPFVAGELRIGGAVASPPLLVAPMAGITHSAFRRLLAEYGGYGALCTEMISTGPLLTEDFAGSPFCRRREEEGKVVYQLLISSLHRFEERLERFLGQVQPWILDLNCGCPVAEFRCAGAGSGLFEDTARLAEVLQRLRKIYAGPLTVKVRLGHETPEWKLRFAERLRLLEDCGVDGLFLHPRFIEDRYKRPARLKLLPELVALTRLPVVVSGDITGSEVIARHPEYFQQVAGVMVGRMVAARPWTVARWGQPALAAPDWGGVWTKLFEYIQEDFRPEQALGRLRIFTKYYARNFLFGQTLRNAVLGATSSAEAFVRAQAFFATNPATVKEPCFSGL